MTPWHILFADPDLTTIYLQTVTVKEERHKYLNMKVCLSKWNEALIIDCDKLNSFEMVIWAVINPISNI